MADLRVCDGCGVHSSHAKIALSGYCPRCLEENTKAKLAIPTRSTPTDEWSLGFREGVKTAARFLRAAAYFHSYMDDSEVAEETADEMEKLNPGYMHHRDTCPRCGPEEE